MRPTCVLAVSGLMTSWLAISALLRPAATRRRMSSSRTVSASSPAGGALRVEAGHELRDQPSGDGRCEERVAGRDHADRVQQLARPGVLEQEPARAGAERGVDVLVEVEGGE